MTAPSASAELPFVPVMRPRLPPAARILPYLERIDRARVYSNWGPLSLELAARLAKHFGVPEGSVVCSSSGTSALVAAILGTAGRASERRLALIPALTFVATAAAVEQCGYEPYLCDVDAETWLLDPERLQRHPLLERVGLVVPVAAYGRPVPLEPWLHFQSATSIPVVIDGAASFEGLEGAPSLHLGDIPVALSFHATKSFATGEGGAIVTRSKGLAERITAAANFGFLSGREAACASTNAKMSEYHAAVGLAELDGWTEKRTLLERVAREYRAACAVQNLAAGLLTVPSIASCYVLYQLESPMDRERAEGALAAAKTDFRAWYGRGVHAQPHYTTVGRDPLPVTTDLSCRLLGLPQAVDLEPESIRRVVAALRSIHTGDSAALGHGVDTLA